MDQNSWNLEVWYRVEDLCGFQRRFLIVYGMFYYEDIRQEVAISS